MDANNQMIPLQYTVVEAETKEASLWFIELVLEDFNIQNVLESIGHQPIYIFRTRSDNL